MEDLGRMLLLFGVLLAVVGGIVLLMGRIPGLGLGRLPGDISIQVNGLSCLFPIATSIILSIVLTIVLNLLLVILRR